MTLNYSNFFPLPYKNTLEMKKNNNDDNYDEIRIITALTASPSSYYYFDNLNNNYNERYNKVKDQLHKFDLNNEELIHISHNLSNIAETYQETY